MFAPPPTHALFQVHERDKDTDFCLLVVRKLLRTNSPHVKVVLMSATIEAEYFARYFSVRLSQSIMVPPIIKVEGRPFPVIEFYLDDIRHLGEVRETSGGKHSLVFLFCVCDFVCLLVVLFVCLLFFV